VSLSVRADAYESGPRHPDVQGNQLAEDGTTPSAIYAVLQLGGPTLRDVRRRTRHDRLSARTTIMLVIDMLRALWALHRFVCINSWP